MQTSGLILDVYDDFRGDTIRSLFPTRSAIPEFVKTAQVLSAEDRNRLPDDAFALVLRNGDEVLRKYACIDAGNTALSVLYFLKNGHKLPEEAQKVAAANLEVACGWYDLNIDDLGKTAGVMGHAVGRLADATLAHPMTAFRVALVGPDVMHDIKENNASVSEIERMHGSHAPISPEQIREHRMMKGAMAHLVPGHKGETENFGPEEGKAETDYTHGEMPKALPQMKQMKPHVDVTEKKASPLRLVKKASHYALGEKYPLDSYEQVKTAGAYFEEYCRSFAPEDRREFCQNFIKRAEALNLPVSESVRHYGGEDFGTPEMLKIAFDLRVRVLEEPEHLDMLTSLFEKAAELGPELFCDTLSEFDKIAGLHYLYDKDVPDPYYSTFYKAASEDYSYLDVNDMVSGEALRVFGKTGFSLLKHMFGEDFAVEFRKDPVGIFKSLPREQKKMVMRMANENSGPDLAPLA